MAPRPALHPVPARPRRAYTRRILTAFVLLAAARPLDAQVPAARVDAEPHVPAVRQQTYQMNARVRPLLFWMRRDDVGSARVTWRGPGTGAFGYELLIGSDPLKAPRRINRWGYIREDVRGDQATIVGVMKASKEQSIEDAEEQIARDGQDGAVFQAIRATVSGREAASGTIRIHTGANLTFREHETLLARMASLEFPRRMLPLPAGTAPGFLTALATLVHDTVAAATGPTGRVRLPPAASYVYNGRLYELRLRSLDARTAPAALGQAPIPVLAGEFQIRNRHTRETTDFSMTYGRTGALAEVPLRVVFRPRWWFEVEIVRVDAGSFAGSAARARPVDAKQAARSPSRRGRGKPAAAATGADRALPAPPDRSRGVRRRAARRAGRLAT